MSTDQLPSPAPPSPNDVQPLVVAGVYRDGVVHPSQPLDLPPDSPVLVVAVAGAPGVPPSAPPMGPAPGATPAKRRAPLGPRLIQAQGRLVAAAEQGRPALLICAVALALIAQWRFLGAGQFELPALLAALLAAPLITLAVAGLPPTPIRPGPPVEKPPVLGAQGLTSGRLVGLVVAGLAGLGVLLGLDGSPPAWRYAPITVLWLAAVVLGTAVFARRPAWPRLRFSREALVAAAPLVALTLAALVLRAWQVGTLPATLSGDEGSQGLEAIKVLRGEIANPFSTGWLGVPTMSFFFNAPTIALLGNTAFALRLPWVLVGTATVVVTYLLVARLHGPLLGLLTAGFLAGFHYHIHFSRLGSNQIADALFVALALLLLFRGYDRREPVAWALCGATVGLAQYFYAGARFTAIVVAAALVLLALRDGRRLWREQRDGLLALVCVGLITAGPMIQYAFRFPNEFDARINMVGIFQSGWLEREVEIRGQSAVMILVDQFWRAALLYNAYPDRTVWYGSPYPLFSVVEGALFILGLGYGLLRLGDRRMFPMVAWWGGAVIMGGMLTESPPSLQRLITTAVPAAFFLCLGLVLAARGLWALFRRGDGLALRATLGAATLILATLSAVYYFADYTPRQIYGSQNAVVATSMAEYARDHFNPTTRIVFFGPPRMYYGFGTIPYLLGPEQQGTDVTEPLQAPVGPDLASPGDDVAFIFLPERVGELPLVQAVFPGGDLEQIPSPTGRDPLYIVYRPR